MKASENMDCCSVIEAEGGHAGFGNDEYRSADKRSLCVKLPLCRVLAPQSDLTWQNGRFRPRFRRDRRVAPPLLRRLLPSTDPHLLLCQRGGCFKAVRTSEPWSGFLPSGTPLTCRTCCSRFHSSSFCLWMSVSCASRSASALFASCSTCSTLSYFCTASCEEEHVRGLRGLLSEGEAVGRAYLSQSLHLLDLGAQSGFHAAYLLLAALQFFSQTLQALSLSCQSVLLLLHLRRVKLQFGLFLQHAVTFTRAEAVATNSSRRRFL